MFHSFRHSTRSLITLLCLVIGIICMVSVPIVSLAANAMPDARPLTTAPSGSARTSGAQLKTPVAKPNTQQTGGMTRVPMPPTKRTTTPTPTAQPTATSVPPTATLTPTATAITPASYWQPSAAQSWQIQYTGTMDYSLPVQVYDLDGFDTTASTVAALHARGVKVACYFSAGSAENWRPDYTQFPASALGNNLSGWAGEKWVDIRNSTVRTIMANRMDMCKQKGFDAIDPDNVDGYTNNTGFPLLAQDQINYNTWLAQQGHQRGLAAFLKNDTDQVATLATLFDGAVVEQCFEYNECNAYLPFVNAGKPVLEIEYNLTTTSFCPQANTMNFNSLKKNLNLDATRTACR